MFFDVIVSINTILNAWGSGTGKDSVGWVGGVYVHISYTCTLTNHSLNYIVLPSFPSYLKKNNAVMLFFQS